MTADGPNLSCIVSVHRQFFTAISLILGAMPDGEDANAIAAAAASASGFDTDAVVCAACSQSSGPFSKRQLKKAQAGEPARK